MSDILNKTIVPMINRNWQAINIRTPAGRSAKRHQNPHCARESRVAGWKIVLANLWNRQTLTKVSKMVRAGRGPETKWEKSVQKCWSTRQKEPHVYE
jgi:hypothetical protein